MSEICIRCGEQSLMFANLPMFPTFCLNCDQTPKGVQVFTMEEE